MSEKPGKELRKKNYALAVILLVLIGLIYAITLMRMEG